MKLCSLIVLLLFSGFPGKTQTESYEFEGTISELIDAISSSHPRLQSLRNEYEKNQLELIKKNRDLKPKLEFKTWYEYYWSDLPTYFFPEAEGRVLSEGSSSGPYPVPLGLRNNLYAGFFFKQTVIDHRLFQFREGSEGIAMLEQLNQEREWENIQFKIGKTYYEWLELSYLLQEIESNEKNLKKAMRVMQTRISNDMVDSLEFEQLELKLELVTIEKERLHKGIDLKMDQLKMECGLESSASIQLISEAKDFLFYEIDESRSALKNPTDSLLAVYKLNLEIKREYDKAPFLPTLDIYANFLANSQSQSINVFTNSNWFNNSLVGLEFSVPIYWGHSKYLANQEADIEQDLLDYKRVIANQGFELQLKAILNELDYLHKKKVQEEKQHQIYIKQHRIVERKFGLGLSGVQERIEAETQLSEGASALNKTRTLIKIKELEFLQLTGQLSEYFAINEE